MLIFTSLSWKFCEAELNITCGTCDSLSVKVSSWLSCEAWGRGLLKNKRQNIKSEYDVVSKKQSN